MNNPQDIMKVSSPALEGMVLVPREAVAQAAAALDVLGRRDLAAWLMRAEAASPAAPAQQVEGWALFVEQMDMLREDFRRYANGDIKVPFPVVREAIVAALNAYDELPATPAASKGDRE